MATAADTSKVGIFKETSGSVKNLRRHYKNPGKDHSSKSISDELTGSSDRAALILIAATVENALIERVSKSLRFLPSSDQEDKIYRFEGPMGTHSARCEIAWLMGFIDDRAFYQLDYLRELRNSFAHANMPMSFTDLKVYNVTSKIFYPLGVLTPQSYSAADSFEFRKSLIMEVLILTNMLKLGSRAEAVKSFSERNNIYVDPKRY